MSSQTMIEVLGVKMGLWETTAPRPYDFDASAISLMGEGGENGGARIVLLPVEGVQSQLARYGSGLYSAAPSDMFDEAQIREELWKRLTVEPRQ